ncbi:TraB/GumN family protein [Cytophagaceae bacterium YF14B1]|uniref:TraB/GumN family protein n=1 Tax=Xanthocytophaga flava TaxID=3048013 RepID=A0AAE3QWH0_9BACT|nr:TraB/GumN family protein [Xanthocytophaga flavus]MDJ1484074.1 TraB/GumN family protein [Xanthocytophaga flavus]
MRIYLSIALIGLTCFCSFAQSSAVKYQGLLWEISGKNLQKPSYLFGTMHVSSKVAFHLGDAFYTSIRNAEVVALETNPDEMQDDYTQSIFQKARSEQYKRKNGRLSSDEFTISDYKKLLQAALSYDPEMLNQLLYRSYMDMEDFEENTFLDLYIYQVGKRLGKRATGVENFRQSEQLVLEALKDMAEEMKQKKTRNREVDEDDYRMLQPHVLTDAYRSGNLDLLDSLSRKQYQSDAFLEKFLYKRNENMFHSIDSIIQKSSLFVGVGAAHLPGDRGLINMLRKAGYTVKPIKMGERDSEQKDQIEKLRVDREFSRQVSDDGWFQVEMPGKLYDFSTPNPLAQRQYADLANGAYYAVSRVKTNGLFLGQTPEQVLDRVDSLLYEHIPGKILSKTPVTKNGYQGFNVKNRSRRGDMQRYQILITPFEVFIFKMSGNGDYIEGKEADRFFSSIQLKEINAASWLPYTPSTGGFQVNLPHVPVSNEHTDASILHEWEAWDKITGNSYMILQKNVNELRTLEEDTTDLSIIEESFLNSDFIKKTVSRKLSTYKGYPCLEVISKTKYGTNNVTRFLLKGTHYYIISGNYKKDRKTVDKFFSSFAFKEFSQGALEAYTDTTLRFSVKIPKGSEPGEGEKLKNLYEDYMPEISPKEEDYRVVEKMLTFRAPASGEEITVAYQKFPKYYSFRNENKFLESELQGIVAGKIVRKKEKTVLNDASGVYIVLQDTNSSRCLLYKLVQRNRILYTLSAVSDTLQGQTAFIKTFFDSFTPTGDPVGKSLYVSKANEFLDDFTSKNVETRQKAKESIHYVEFQDSDAPRLIQLIQQANAKEKGYLDTKRLLIGQLGTLHHPQILPFLKSAYQNTNDTTTLQYAILNALTLQKTQEAYTVFKEIVLNEPPIFNSQTDLNGLFYPLRDSLALTKHLFPDLLKLASLSDYRDPVYGTLAMLVDSSFVNSKTYDSYLGQMIYDARIATKRHFAQEEERKMAEESEDEDSYYEYEGDTNSGLTNFATLLAPYRDQNKNVDRLFGRLLQSSDNSTVIEVVKVLLKNKQNVSDSLLEQLASDNKYRALLYTKLQSINRLDKFPKRYASQELIARSLLYQQRGYNTTTDTLVFINKQVTGYSLKKGYVYFYKYKKSENDEWYIAISGLQPLNEKQIDTEASLVRMTEKKIRKGKPLTEQFAKALRDLKLEEHRDDISMEVSSLLE